MSGEIRAGMTGSAALNIAVARLKAAGIDTPQRDARRLLAWALNSTTDRLALALAEDLDARSAAAFDSAVGKRARRMPVSMILGRREFFGRDFLVTADVLDPRPETETLIELALSEPFDCVLDLGTGTGCILLSLLAERPQLSGVGVDISPSACAVARQNCARLDLGDRARIIQSDWFELVEGTFDLIVANPPYVTTEEMAGLAPEVRDWDPSLALYAGNDGLAAYPAITAAVMPHLAENGRLMAEIGPTQAAGVSELFRRAGLHKIHVAPDLDGRDRVVIGRRVGVNKA